MFEDNLRRYRGEMRLYINIEYILIESIISNHLNYQSQYQWHCPYGVADITDIQGLSKKKEFRLILSFTNT